MKCKIVLKDEVNCKVEGLATSTRRKCMDKLKFFLPYAYHVPAYKLGRWDGTVQFFSMGGSTYINLLDEILPILESDGYEIELDDHRQHVDFATEAVDENTYTNLTWPKGHPVEGQPIVLRDYQVDIINQFLDTPQCVQEIATGAGKTLITAALSERVESYGRTVVIVPNKDLVRQTAEDYENMGLDVGVYFGDKKEMNKTHTICTWQSLNTMEKRFRDGLSETSLAEFLQGVVCVMVDEVHQAKADVLKKLLTGPFSNVPLRWGLTGTIPKEQHEFFGIRAGLGQVINKLSAHELQEEGVLAECNIDVIQMQDTADFPNYQSELTYLVTDQKRLNYISGLIDEMSKNGNTLVLVDRIKCGEKLQELLPNATFVKGAMKSADRKDTYTEINESTNMVVIATYGVAAVGINIPRIFNLVLIEPGKSFVRVIQSIGRGIRKAKDKDHIQIWDITSSCKFSKRHLTQRKKFYREAHYPFSVQKVDYI
jgi:superfamily II DNA or RNA helicase